MFQRVHHVNFIVHDLQAAAERFGRLLGQPLRPVERLPERGVELVRFRIGDAWLVLVHPVDAESAPGRYLAEHGEGFFLLSCEVEDVGESTHHLEACGFSFTHKQPRSGLDDWRVVDLDPAELFGIHFQLVETGARSKSRAER